MAENKISTQDLVKRPHILVVDDDDRIRSLVSRYLNEHGFLSFTAPDASSARSILELGIFDALLIDVMMPDEDGLSLTRFLRSQAQTNGLPIILLTAMGEADDKIFGFQSGADDYITKPFDPRELVLRLKVILKRSEKTVVDGVSYRIGSWSYDTSVPELRGEGQTIRLTDTEVSLLGSLLKRRGEMMTREDLAKACGLDAGERTIDVQVTRLRRKLEEDTKAPRYLLTIRGKGYLLRAESVQT